MSNILHGEVVNKIKDPNNANMCGWLSQWSVQTHTDLFAPVGNHVHKDDAFEMDAVVDIENVSVPSAN